MTKVGLSFHMVLNKKMGEACKKSLVTVGRAHVPVEQKQELKFSELIILTNLLISDTFERHGVNKKRIHCRVGRELHEPHCLLSTPGLVLFAITMVCFQF